MLATADLPPGARSRIWALLTVTATVGLLMWLTFERTVILWVSALCFSVLVYLLAGIELTLRVERRRLMPLVNRATMSVREREDLWVILSANGTILHLSDAGIRGLEHDAKLLEGQRLTDVVPDAPLGARAAIGELLRFAAAQTQPDESWAADVPIVSQSGSIKRHRLRTLRIYDPQARKAGLVALSGVVTARETNPGP